MNEQFLEKVLQNSTTIAILLLIWYEDRKLLIRYLEKILEKLEGKKNGKG